MLLGGAGSQAKSVRNALLCWTSQLRTVFLTPETADAGYGDHILSHSQ